MQLFRCGIKPIDKEEILIAFSLRPAKPSLLYKLRLQEKQQVEKISAECPATIKTTEKNSQVKLFYPVQRNAYYDLKL